MYITVERQSVQRLLRGAKQSGVSRPEGRRKKGRDCWLPRSHPFPFVPRRSQGMARGLQQPWILLFQPPQLLSSQKSPWIGNRHDLSPQNREAPVPNTLFSTKRPRQPQ